ncbi:MAG: hypothetical protein ACP5JG_19065 [Anaerolineae bacterium]
MKLRQMKVWIFGLVVFLTLGACAPLPSDAADVPTDAPAMAPSESVDVAPPPASGPSQGDVVGDPADVVAEFYTWYLGYQGNVQAEKAYHGHLLISPVFSKTVDERLASFDKGGYDLFICAQDRLNEVWLGTTTISGDTAEVEVTSALEGHSFTVELVATESGWQINEVDCGFEADDAAVEPAPVGEPAQETAPQTGSDGAPREGVPGWPVFVDETYHFMVQYPEGWSYEDVDLDDPNKPPAGNMERLVFFAPENWEEPFIAWQLEVYDMDDETFAMEFPPASSDEEVVRDDGLTYKKLIHDFGQATMYQYLFTDPSNPNVRVIFTDYVSGWSDRLEGNEEVVAQFAPMLQSFGFTE